MEEVIRCPYCGAELEELPTQCAVCAHRIEVESWELVAEVATEWEAELLRGRLLQHGVPAQVLSQRDSTRMFTIGALAVVKLFVPAAYAELARKVLQQREEP